MDIVKVLDKLGNTYKEASIHEFMGKDVKDVIEHIFMVYEKEVVPAIEYLSVHEKTSLLNFLENEDKTNIFKEQTINIIKNSLGLSKKIK